MSILQKLAEFWKWLADDWGDFPPHRKADDD